MRLNSALLAVVGVTTLTIGCLQGMVPTEESPSAPITVTEMTQLPNGSWITTSSRTIPGGQTFRPDVGDGIEARQSALYVVPCSNNWQVALWSGTNFSGNVLCLNANGNTQRLNFGWLFSARSVYTITPLMLYGPGGDANDTRVFCSWEQGVGRFSGSLWPAATSAQEGATQAVCHF